VLGEDRGDGAPGARLDLAVGVDEAPAEPLGERRRDRALAGAHHADQEDAARPRREHVVGAHRGRRYRSTKLAALAALAALGHAALTPPARGAPRARRAASPAA